MNNHISTGKKGEDIAVSYLKKSGYRIIERNFRCNIGEIDIVAQEGATIVFVEVKSRRSNKFGEPQYAVGIAKQKKLSLLALQYLQERKMSSCNARFDVVAIMMHPEENRIELIKNAFDLLAY